MKSTSYLLAVVVLLAAPAAAAAQAAEAWQKLAPPADGFSVLMPTQAAHETQTNPADPRMKMEIYSSEGAGRFFYISSLNFAGLSRRTRAASSRSSKASSTPSAARSARAASTAKRPSTAT
ncbi:MAG TPA: hypothetical protein VER08_04030 [Pyrinomonadaceae bacterium]|nr:hypothetical protein [Pyrinomonadaceae bacterium]